MAKSRNCLQNSVGLPARGEDLSAFGNYSGYCGTRSLLLNSFTSYVFNFVPIEFIPGRPVRVVEQSFSRLVDKFELLKSNNFPPKHNSAVKFCSNLNAVCIQHVR